MMTREEVIGHARALNELMGIDSVCVKDIVTHDAELRQVIVQQARQIAELQAFCEQAKLYAHNLERKVRRGREALHGMMRFTNLTGYEEYRDAKKALEETA